MHVGIIGCGNISETYFNSQNIYNNFKVISCADINIDVAKQSAEKFNVKGVTAYLGNGVSFVSSISSLNQRLEDEAAAASSTVTHG